MLSRISSTGKTQAESGHASWKKKEMNDDEFCTGASVSQRHWWFLDDSARTARNIKHAVLYENASFTADITWEKIICIKKMKYDIHACGVCFSLNISNSVSFT